MNEEIKKLSSEGKKSTEEMNKKMDDIKNEMNKKIDDRMNNMDKKIDELKDLLTNNLR